MSSTYQDRSISNCMKNMKSQTRKSSSIYEESDTPLNQFLQEKYEKAQVPFYNSRISYSNPIENSPSLDDFKEDSYYHIQKSSKAYISKPNEKIDQSESGLKIHSLQCRIKELIKIQDTLIKNIEDIKISSIKTEQTDKKTILELREKLNLASSRISNLEDLLKNDGKDQLKKYIKDLEASYDKIKQENQTLISRFQVIDQDLHSIEFESKNMRDEIQTLKSQNSALQNEIINLKAQKVEDLKNVDRLSCENRVKDQKINELVDIINKCEGRIQDLKDLINSLSMNKYQDYSLKLDSSDMSYRILKLTKENEALKTQMSTRPTTTTNYYGKKNTTSTEKLVDSINLYSTIPHKRSKSVGKKFSYASSSKILKDLMNEIGLDSPYGLIEIYRKITKENKQAAKAVELFDKLMNLVEKFSPQGTFKKSPSVNKIWKWIKKLVDEFFKIKKDAENFEDTMRALAKVKCALNVVDNEDPVQVAGKIIMENEYLKLLLNKVKIIFRVNRKITLTELEGEIDKRL
ncbi:hypothetical protein SteCoe_25926 [Stentor coeruleus]|uniref:Uncharacterized protein n=1 Tax=Stentor coeruleus TaxID=5963 RepID=A0A1R2BE63_9CILI|nr:hypothetical protein SteCoe_25926 [Stentor coeruleus]